MNRDQLIQSAQSLPKVSTQAAHEYAQKMESMVSQINQHMLARVDLGELIGPNNTQMMKDNHSNHARFIHSILNYFDAEVLVDTILWVFRAYRNHHFSSNYWAAQLNAWIELIKENLSNEASSEILPLYVWMQINIPSFVLCSDELLTGATPKH